MLTSSMIAGCVPSVGETPLVVATSWPAEVRQLLETSSREQDPAIPAIEWVVLDPGRRMDLVIDRRGGIDILLGGSIASHEALASAGLSVAIDPPIGVSWAIARRPRVSHLVYNGPVGDPRDDPATIGQAKALIEASGWSRGYEAIVRRSAQVRRLPQVARDLDRAAGLVEGVSLVRDGKSPLRARQFLEALERRKLVEVATASVIEASKADGLLADLLGAALVDSSDGLHEAEAALVRHGRPIKADAAIVEPPPWPPASVSKLLTSSNGELLVETLLSQIAPDPRSRSWLMESWSRPKRPIDGPLLAEIASAVEGRLAREPRFRAWLRGEWTAWTRQLYRRVVRVAGGYVPS